MVGTPRVMFLAPSAYRWGGVQSWLDQTCEGLKAKGWDVSLALVAGPVFHRPDSYAAAHPGHRVVPVRCGTGTPEGRVRAISRVLARERPDLLVLVNVGDGLEAVRRQRQIEGRRAPRLAYAIHGFEVGQLCDLTAYKGLPDRIISTNRLTQRIVTEIVGEAPERIGYAPYGAEAPLERCCSTEAGGSLRVAWIGRIEQGQKRALDLPEILGRCEALGVDFQCEVAGEGPCLEEVRVRTGALQERGRLRFRGLVSREELYRTVYPGLDVLLVTSMWETGPIVAWEAMRHGATLVSTRYLGCREEGALRDGENCLLAPVGDTQALAEAVARLDRDRALLERLGSAGRSMTEARYCLEASAEAWERELDAALTGESRRAELPRREPRVVGRLDRLLGRRAAESVRRLLGRVMRPQDPGDEWPHAISRDVQLAQHLEERLATLLASQAGDPALQGAARQAAGAPTVRKGSEK